MKLYPTLIWTFTILAFVFLFFSLRTKTDEMLYSLIALGLWGVAFLINSSSQSRMKRRRKHSRCLNCAEPLGRKFNYCPNCGQENTNNNVNLGLLLREFTSNFFSLDSRFAHTFKPFLFSPGKITNAFMEGKRVFYANPIRWYLVISLFHFFFMSKMFQPTVKDMQQRGFFALDVELSEAEFDSIYHAPDSTDGWPFPNNKQKLVNHLVEHSSLTDQEIYDSLKFERSWINAFATKKAIRTSRETTASMNSYIMKQIPLIIFFILPVYALILKLFFWRKGLYIKHLIHSIHLHSLLFFLMGWTWVLALIFEDFEDYGLPITGLLITLYSIISYHKVYKIKVIWGVFRVFMIGIVYTVVLSFSLLLGVMISIALI